MSGFTFIGEDFEYDIEVRDAEDWRAFISPDGPEVTLHLSKHLEDMIQDSVNDWLNDEDNRVGDVLYDEMIDNGLEQED